MTKSMTPHRRSHPELYAPGGRCYFPTYPDSAPRFVPAIASVVPTVVVAAQVKTEDGFGLGCLKLLGYLVLMAFFILFPITISPIGILILLVCYSNYQSQKQLDEIQKQLDARA